MPLMKGKSSGCFVIFRFIFLIFALGDFGQNQSFFYAMEDGKLLGLLIFKLFFG
ncbi:hypothetical protein P872_16630 [Rhodonellum psychrophilum GCM71 = DSM 17998]|uniref:Uncharacterized protein n=1 Tax=Rhodonellum psychrophilum GCM71 = DSM 17998 TaxID=1123057 RepID=U5C0G4_9BACT|nr:hypothetical protein P872_16630 [Rhodonellum psychrophilum GCM71 = DSM 17998]